MPRLNNLIGKRFGRLTVTGRDASKKGVYWLCECDCGKTKSVMARNLTSGATRSCGCYQSEVQTENLVGQKFGRLTVIQRGKCSNDNKKEHHAYWECLCECGNTHIVRSSDLKNGQVRSCGCLQIEANTKHGLRKHPIYTLWCNVKSRCYNPKNKHFKDYGGRGIKMCDRWRYDAKAFFDDVSVLPHYGEKGYSLNRLDNNGDYEPCNVEWANNTAQANNKRNNHLITYNGKTQTIAQWAADIGLNPYTLYNRVLTYHWPIERALTEPTKTSKHS